MDPAHVDRVIGEVSDSLECKRRRKPGLPTFRWWQFSLRTFLACAFLAPIGAWVVFAVIPELLRPKGLIRVSKSISYGKFGGRQMHVEFHAGPRCEEYIEYEPFDGKADFIRCNGMTFGTQLGCTAPIASTMQQRYSAVLTVVRQKFEPGYARFLRSRATFRGELQPVWPQWRASFQISRKDEERLRMQRSDFPAATVPSGY